MSMVTTSAFAKSYKDNCFREHITESIGINSKRKKAYAKLTNGQSDRIFTTLISSEVATLIPASYFDLKARAYQKKGLELFCHEFVSLNHAPIFDPENRIRPTEKFRPFDWKFYQLRLEDAMKARKINLVRKISLEALMELKSYPHYYCMTRHLIESIYRFAFFVPLREEEAKSQNLTPPTEIMLDVMKLHLLPFSLSYKIDIWSQPIQESGIPILCSEIPDLLFDLDAPELADFKEGAK